MSEAFMIMNFCTWIKGGSLNTLDKANILSNSLFDKQYNDLYTYERNYLISQMAHWEA